MTVKADYKFDDRQIESMDLTISITMKVGEWRNFMRAQPLGYETNKISAIIVCALGDLTRAVGVKYEYPKGD